MSLEPTRVVEIDVSSSESSRGRSYGSGYLLTQRLVLTARHVVDLALPGEPVVPPAVPLPRRSGEDPVSDGHVCHVRPLSDQAGGPRFEARVVWWRTDVDVALLAITDDSWTPPTRRVVVEWADISGARTVRCLAVGFPAADTIRESARVIRDSREIEGTIPPQSGRKSGLWTVHVEHHTGPSESPSGSWAGMSGAAVFVDDALVGVIGVDAEPGDHRRLELRSSKFVDFGGDADFAAWLAADAGPGVLQQVTVPRTPSVELIPRCRQPAPMRWSDDRHSSMRSSTISSRVVTRPCCRDSPASARLRSPSRWFTINEFDRGSRRSRCGYRSVFTVRTGSHIGRIACPNGRDSSM